MYRTENAVVLEEFPCNALTACLAGDGEVCIDLLGNTATAPPLDDTTTHQTSSGSGTSRTAFQQCWARSGVRTAGEERPSLSHITRRFRPHAPHSRRQPLGVWSALTAVAVAPPKRFLNGFVKLVNLSLMIIK